MRKIAERKGKVKEVVRVVGKEEEGAREKITADQKNENVRQSKKTRRVLI